MHGEMPSLFAGVLSVFGQPLSEFAKLPFVFVGMLSVFGRHLCEFRRMLHSFRPMPCAFRGVPL
jgi:hypothetical protein